MAFFFLGVPVINLLHDFMTRRSMWVLRLQAVEKHCIDTETHSGAVPGPSKQGRSSTCQSHDPREGQPDDGVLLLKAEVCHGFAHHDVALDGQDHQGPESDLPYGTAKKKKKTRDHQVASVTERGTF